MKDKILLSRRIIIPTWDETYRYSITENPFQGDDNSIFNEPLAQLLGIEIFPERVEKGDVFFEMVQLFPYRVDIAARKYVSFLFSADSVASLIEEEGKPTLRKPYIKAGSLNLPSVCRGHFGREFDLELAIKHAPVMEVAEEISEISRKRQIYALHFCSGREI